MLFKTCTKCNTENSTDQFYKQKSGKYGFTSACKECLKEYHHKNKETIAAYKKQYRLDNPDIRAASQRKWQQNNRDKSYAANARYRSSAKEATPSWADKEAIAGMYQLAAIFNSTGINLHVDHIVPLKSNKVCGLHTEDNLRLLPATENITKGNRYWDDMWTTT